jgi:RND family efflux transporter MFP subunit
MPYVRLALLKWPVTLLGLAALLGAAHVINGLAQEERAAEADDEKVAVPRRVEHEVVKLGPELAARRGIKDEPARAISWSPRLTVYGRVVPNPQATVEVRSPFPGTLRMAPDVPWPTPGRWVRAGQVVGRVDIRIGPQERLDLQAKLNEARLKLQGAREVLKVQQARVDRFQQAGESESLSRKELDEALVALTDARTQAATAQAAIELWRQALRVIERRDERSRSTWSEPLTAPADGEVAELTAKPGMAVEAGGVVARVIDFRRTLVRLDFPAEALADGAPPQVELVAATGAGSESKAAVTATLVGPAPQVDVTSQFTGYWYEAQQSGTTTAAGRNGRLPWRPGLFVQASVPTGAGEKQKAVTVPQTALVDHDKRSFVYVRRTPGQFERREVRVLGREGERVVVAGEVAPGEAVVYRQTQVLLSEEYRGGEDND